MSGGSKKQTIGYRYLQGLFFGLVHGPIDFLTRIRVDEEQVWSGLVSNSQKITINAEEVFGGESAEGGISGEMDLQFGEDTQAQNDYLVGQLGSGIPNFRGLVTAVLRKGYLSMNPFYKPWAFKATRTQIGHDGQEQWYPEKAPIGAFSSTETAFYFAMDQSISMQNVPGGGTNTKWENLRSAMIQVIDYIWNTLQPGTASFQFIEWGSWQASGNHLRDNVNKEYNVNSQATIDAIKADIDADGLPGFNTYFPAAVIDANSFFTDPAVSDPSVRKLLFFITDGEPNDAGSGQTAQEIADATKVIINALPSEVSIHGINIDDTDTTYTKIATGNSQVPVVSGGDPQAIIDIVVSVITGNIDMNPAHIIRECILNPLWGMGYSVADIDEVAFISAADTLFNESFGLSFLWATETEVNDFIQDVLNHIDAALFIDQRTGKFVLKLIRDDYNVNDLPVFDESNIKSVDAYHIPTTDELINYVNIEYFDYTRDQEGTVSGQDTGLVVAQGGLISQTFKFPGISVTALALKVLQRELKAAATPLKSATLILNRQGFQLNIGDVFKWGYPSYGIANLVMRVTNISYGTLIDGAMEIECIEDIFGLPNAIVTEPLPTLWTDPTNPPEDITRFLITEAPYWEIIQTQGESFVLDPTDSYLLAAGSRPTSDSLDATIWTGTPAVETTTMPFAPSCILAADLDRVDFAGNLIITVDISDGVDLSYVEPGQAIQIGGHTGEIAEVVSLVGTTLTINRGALDTVPVDHLTGAEIIFWGEDSGSDEVEYMDGETLSVQLRNRTVKGSQIDAFANNIIFQGRAFKPYPPGQFKGAGLTDSITYPPSYNISSYPLDDGITFTWNHRDRTLLTSSSLIDHDEAGTAATEAGATYRIDAYAFDSSDIEIPGNPYWTSGSILGTLTTFDYPALTAVPSGTIRVEFRITSVRDGEDSWQLPTLTSFSSLSIPVITLASSQPLTAPKIQIAFTI